MSEAPSSGSESTAAQAPAAGVQTLSRTPEQASQALSERTQSRRLEAESQQALSDLGAQRGADGKFLPKGQKQTSSDAQAPTAKAKAGQATPPTPDAAKASEDSPQTKKLSADLKALTDKHTAEAKSHGEAKAKIAEWEQTGEQVVARLATLNNRIEWLEAKLAEHGGEVDQGTMENMTLKEQLRVRELADERAQAAADAEAERAEAAAEAQKAQAERGELRNAYAEVLKAHPELLPDRQTKFQNKPEAGKFWKGLVDALGAGASLAHIRPMLAAAPYVAQVVSAKKSAAPTQAAPRTLSSVRSPGGEPRAVDRQSIVEKHKARLRVS